MYEIALDTALGRDDQYTLMVSLNEKVLSVHWSLSDAQTGSVVTSGIVDLKKWQTDLLNRLW